MPDGTLSKLPLIKPSHAGGLSFLKSIPAPKAKKPALSVTEAKKAAKLLQGMGQTVTAISVNPDGGFTVSAAPGTIAANEPNEWD